MSVKVVQGNLLESKAHTLVNTVNTVGVMGKGIALQFRKRFPDMYDDYVWRCNRGEVRLGEPYLYRQLIPPWIINFPTKEHWRSVARLDAIVNGIRHLRANYVSWEIESLAVPPLGCGNGQLEWSVVGPTLFRELSTFDIPVELYAPYGTPHAELEVSYLEAADENLRLHEGLRTFMQPSWVALAEILHRIHEDPHHRPIGRVSFQKIAYFATGAGIPTGLEYKRGTFGPYADDAKRIVARLQQHGLVTEVRLGRMFGVVPGATLQDARTAYAAALRNWESAINRVVELFRRLDTRRAELVASVHFAATRLAHQLQRRPTEREVLQAVLEWKRRHRPPPNERDIALAIRNLAMLEWINVSASEDLPVEEDLVAPF